MNDQQAIELLKRGDLDGLAFLVRHHQVEALRVADLIVRERALAEDVVQSAFLRVAERIDQFESGRPFAPWFLRIVRNDAIKAARRRERTLAVDYESEAGEQLLTRLLAHHEQTPADAAEAADLRERVWEALGQLPPEQRDAIVQRYYLEWSEAEMMAATEAPRGTIKWRLHRARERLAHLLQPAASSPVEPDQKEWEVER